MALFQKLQRTVCKLTRPVVQKANTTELALSEEDEETCDYAVALQNCLIGLANEVYGVADPRDISGRVLRQACDFYDADWCGLFDVDRMLKLLVPFWWYNRTTGGMTKTKLDEGGVYGDFTRWMDALNTNTPIYVDDIEKIKNSNPEEYTVYSKQEVRSILAVPYYKREKGFLLLRNPKRYGDKPEMLQIMANILVAEINEQKHLDWHNSKWELFIVVHGHGLIQERNISTGEMVEFEVGGDKIEAIHMIPGWTHNIINLSDTEDLVTVMTCNEVFDPNRPDTFFEVV